jgi:hypothetical protein
MDLISCFPSATLTLAPSQVSGNVPAASPEYVSSLGDIVRLHSTQAAPNRRGRKERVTDLPYP